MSKKDRNHRSAQEEFLYNSRWRFPVLLIALPISVVVGAVRGVVQSFREFWGFLLGKKPEDKMHGGQVITKDATVQSVVLARDPVLLAGKLRFAQQVHDFIGQSISTEMITLKMGEKPKGIAQKQLQAEVWSQIHQSGMIQIDDARDEGARAPFVSLQGKIEGIIANALEHGKIKGAVGVIHTPTVATPLRKDPKGDITVGLVADEIVNDPERLTTITDRAGSVRRFMQAGGTLVTAHMDHQKLPEKVRSALKPEQMEVYRKTKEQFGDRLIDKTLAFDGDVFPNEYSGATYIIQGNDGELYSFSIWAYQANNIQEGKAPWGLWFGEMSKEPVAERFHKINNELLRPQGIDMLQLLAQNVEMQNERREVVDSRQLTVGS